MTLSRRDQGSRVFVRRVPDVTTLFGPRPCYEVGTFPAGQSTPVETKRTRKPTVLLRRAAIHTTDSWDFVRNADQAWTGGVGPWRGIFPYETPELVTAPTSSGAGGTVFTELLAALRDLLETAYEPQWARRLDALAAAADQDEPEGRRSLVSAVLTQFGGSGSFSDLVLQRDGRVLPQQGELDRLRSQLFEAAREELA